MLGVYLQASKRHRGKRYTQQLLTLFRLAAPRAHVQVVTIARKLLQHVHMYERHMVIRDAVGVKREVVILNRVPPPKRPVEVKEQAPRHAVCLQVAKPQRKHFFFN
ncbi:MAG: hypothetical protein CL450_05910 [Acidimicrobiaceae bacterium]|nr:hypothetical protein [Acidimicrobiaceae bacterium]